MASCGHDWPLLRGIQPFGWGDWMVFLITLIASSVGMIVRQEIGHRQFNPLINFAATAFVTSVISAQAVIYQLGNKPTIVMASSVLMLVPGFPLINAVADMLKGYINMGIARFVMASLLTLATALGIVAAMSITGIWGGNVKLGSVFRTTQRHVFCRDSGGWVCFSLQCACARIEILCVRWCTWSWLALFDDALWRTD